MLDDESQKLLKFVNGFKTGTSLDIIEKKFGGEISHALEFLEKQEYINCYDPAKDIGNFGDNFVSDGFCLYTITHFGKSYLKSYRFDKIKFLLPLFISLVSLLISIIAIKK